MKSRIDEIKNRWLHYRELKNKIRVNLMRTLVDLASYEFLRRFLVAGSLMFCAGISLLAIGCQRVPVPAAPKPSAVVESPRVVEFRKMVVELSWSGLPLQERGEMLMSRMRLLEFTDDAKRTELLAKGDKMVKSLEPETIKQLAKEILEEMPEPTETK